MSWNVNGMTHEKLLLGDTLTYFDDFDVIFLTETRCIVLPQKFLPTYETFHVPASSPGKAGEGLLISVRRSMNANANVISLEKTSIWLTLTSHKWLKALTIAFVNIPPQGSRQRVDLTLGQRFGDLQRQALLASPQGQYYNCRGLARVADLSDEHIPILSPRGFSDPQVKLHGRKLLSFCQASDFYLSTGRTPGNLAGQASFQARSKTQVLRLNHLVAAHANTFDLLHSCIDESRYESDHYPINLSIALSRIEAIEAQHDGQVIGKYQWNQDKRLLYEDLLLSVKLDGNDGSTKAQSFVSQICCAAERAGMPRFLVTGKSGIHKPFFDQQCLRMKIAVRAHHRQYGIETRSFGGCREHSMPTLGLSGGVLSGRSLLSSSISND